MGKWEARVNLPLRPETSTEVVQWGVPEGVPLTEAIRSALSRGVSPADSLMGDILCRAGLTPLQKQAHW